ncbi:MAG TPA: hypothetical protein DEQ38_03720 [Elusimicrobia bacterium]|nr:MAG: hypothetical protein A2089_02915 [Elusimicrobia bacterium GWD2_63_28]HCC47212.1 hypothetical protein [Elusimicrobiota bacterium]
MPPLNTQTADAGPQGTERSAVIALLLAALLIRVLYAAFNGVLPWNDMAGWNQGRLELLRGEPYTVHWTPLYPFLLAQVSRLTGENYFLLNCVNAVLNTFACLFTWQAAREVFGRRTALLALAAAAFYVDTVWYSATMLAENLALMMIALLTLRFVKDGKPAVNGFIFGLACLTKGLFLALFPGFIYWLYLKYRLEGWRKKAAVFTGVALLTIAPWAARNFMVYKAPVLLEPHWASAVFVGHNPYATGGCDYYFLDHEYGDFYKDPSLSIIETNRIFIKKSVEFALGNPLRELQLVVLKASKHLTFSTSFVYNSGDYPARKWMYALSLLQHMLIFPLCVFGMAFSFSDKKAFGFSMIVGILAGAFITLFSANTRMRIPFASAMLVLAAHGAALLPGLLAKVRSGGAGEIKGRLYAAVSVTALLYLNFLYQLLTRYRDVTSRFG